MQTTPPILMRLSTGKNFLAPFSWNRRRGEKSSPLPRLATLILGSLLGLLLWETPGAAQQAAGVAQKTTPAPNQEAADNSLERLENSLLAIVQKARRLVVTIEGRFAVLETYPPDTPPPTGQTGRAPSGQKDPIPPGEVPVQPDRAGADPPIRVFENAWRQRTRAEVKTVGTGFLIPGGFVVTTTEVAALKDLVIRTSEGRVLKVAWINADPNTNLAVCKVENAESLGGLSWGDSDRVRPGSLAIPLGNQAGYPTISTLGIVTGTQLKGRGSDASYDNLILFQGVVGGGGSGGPVLNVRGEVMGVIIGAPTGSTLPGGFNSMAFALPSNNIRERVAALSRREVISLPTGWLGVFLQAEEGESPLVNEVVIGAAADKAGIRPGDKLLAFNGTELETLPEFQNRFRTLRPGSTIRLKIRRGDKTMEVPIKIEPRPSKTAIDSMPRRRRE